MTTDSMVLAFIRNTRRSIPAGDISASEEAEIKKCYRECLEMIVSNQSETYIPSLIISDSFNKYSCLMPIRSGKKRYRYYVLYDVHLKEIFRLLNSLYLEEDYPGHDIWKLSYELFAEDALLNDNEILLSYYGLNKVALGPFEVANRCQTNQDYLLDIQQRYIIGHELGHWLFKLSADTQVHGNISLPLPVLMDDIKQLLSELYVAYEQIFRNQDYVGLIQEQKSIVMENSIILEECFADAIAYAMIFSYVQSSYPGDHEKMLLAGKSLLLEMLHLQLLAMQHMATAEESFESSISIRLGFLRNYAYLYFKDNEEIFERMLEETILRYEQRITDPMLECFAELEHRADQIYEELTGEDGLLDPGRMLGLSDISRM